MLKRFTYLFSSSFQLHRPNLVSSVLGGTQETEELLVCAAEGSQASVVPLTQVALWTSCVCRSPGSLAYGQGISCILLLPLLAAAIASFCVSHHLSQSCVDDQLRSAGKYPATFRTPDATVTIPAVLDAVQAEVVSTEHSHRIPQQPATDWTAEAIDPHRDTRLCHVWEEKSSARQVLVSLPESGWDLNI